MCVQHETSQKWKLLILLWFVLHFIEYSANLSKQNSQPDKTLMGHLNTKHCCLFSRKVKWPPDHDVPCLASNIRWRKQDQVSVFPIVTKLWHLIVTTLRVTMMNHINDENLNHSKSIALLRQLLPWWEPSSAYLQNVNSGLGKFLNSLTTQKL